MRSAIASLGQFALWMCFSLVAVGSEPTLSNGGSQTTHGPWAFNSPFKGSLPRPQANGQVYNPIDTFVLSRLEQQGLALNPPEDAAHLLRRVTYSLTGLPPTVLELETFLADSSPDAYNRAVERLLASPQFGPRWAQHWLDVVRYAESDGFKSDELRPNAYRYRDYVIDAMNANLPYDRFIAQQLAGDELEPENPQAMIATGMSRLYPDEDNAANLFQRRQEILDDITETTGLAILGLTMGCAQCHDHKFDEILQADYFRLQAYFVPFVERDDIPVASPLEQHAYATQLAKWTAATAQVRSEIDLLLSEAREEATNYSLSKFEPAIQDCYRTPPEKRTPYEEQIARIAAKQVDNSTKPDALAKKLSVEDKQNYERLNSKLAEFDHLKPKPLPLAMAISDVGRQAPPTFLLDGGNWRNPLEEIQPGIPVFLANSNVARRSAVGNNNNNIPQHPADPSSPLQHNAAPLQENFQPTDSPPNPNSTGRRTELAQWLTSQDHPLTARVIVNRLWHHHFGRGIVATPNDFGIQGDPPTHPELLDWLAVELMEHDWSLKHIHRLIVTSATYRQSSAVDPSNPRHALAAKIDPQNQLWWHANQRRLEGEAVRDAMLFATGLLSHQMFGPSARPKLPDGVSKRYAWDADDELHDQRRRSVFVLSKRNMRFPLFDAFDLPDMHNSCGCRSQSTTPPQALLLLNGEDSLELAQEWAVDLDRRFAQSPIQLVEQAYLAAFSRYPSSQEVRLSLEFLGHTSSSRLAGDANQQISIDAVTDFCHALFNCNEFIYVD